jgi:choline dehydrogenase-like flavoprotein
MEDEVIVIGSGAAGVAATLGLTDHGLRPTVIDVGIDAPLEAPLQGNFYELRQHQDMFDIMIGRGFERVRSRRRYAFPLPAKLVAPRIQFITRDTDRLHPLATQAFAAVRSFSMGGLANAWGAGLGRITDDQYLVNYPIRASVLSAHYDRLTAEFGVSGENDDLARFDGTAADLQPPLRLSRKAAWLLARYRQRRAKFNAEGVFLGRPRLAVLSEPRGDRGACDYSNLEFWEPNLPFIYTPRLTLNRLIKENRICYRKGLLAESWSREGGKLIVHVRDVAAGSLASFPTRHLVLAAGAIGSARLALASRGDCRTTLPLLENSARQFPLILPRFIGSALEAECFGLTQLGLIYETPEYRSPLAAGILEITSPARAEFFGSLPLAASDNLRMIRHLVPAMLVAQLFFPTASPQAAKLSLSTDGTLRIDGADPPVDPTVIKRFVTIFRKMGAITHPSLVAVPPPGQQSLHYAGTLPMSDAGAGPYQCTRSCQLGGEPNVYVVDGSALPHSPSAGYAFLMMANAMRVACLLAQKIRGES